MICKRTHQLKRKGDYWTIARSACGQEKVREKTTTSWDQVSCPKCLRDYLMITELKIKQVQERISHAKSI